MAKDISRKGQNGTLGVIVGAVITIVIIVAMAVPVTQSIVFNLTCGAPGTNLSACTPKVSGTTTTILNLLPLFFGLAGLITVAALFS